LHPFHPPGVSALAIVETMQMQKAMHDVQSKFAHERISEPASVPSRCFNADKDFAMLKRQHVGRAGLIEESSMHRRHSAIRDKPNKNLAQPG
jgi:hypothetical protein